MSDPSVRVVAVPDAPDPADHAHLFLPSDIVSADLRAADEMMTPKPFVRRCQLCGASVDLMPDARTRRDAPPRRRGRSAWPDPPR